MAIRYKKLLLYLDCGESRFYVLLLTQQPTSNITACLHSYRQHKWTSKVKCVVSRSYNTLHSIIILQVFVFGVSGNHIYLRFTLTSCYISYNPKPVFTDVSKLHRIQHILRHPHHLLGKKSFCLLLISKFQGERYWSWRNPSYTLFSYFFLRGFLMYFICTKGFRMLFDNQILSLKVCIHF
jgi:hypothetical protein